MKFFHLVCLLAVVMLTSAGCVSVSRSSSKCGIPDPCGCSDTGCNGEYGCSPAPACYPVADCNDKMVPMFHQNMVGANEVYYPMDGPFGGRRPLRNLCGCIACIRSNGLGHGCLFGGGNQMGNYDGPYYTTRGPRDFFYSPQPLGY